jgi:hypothetical protein
MGGHDRWYNRDAVTGLRKRQQGMWGTAFERDVGLELSNAAGCVKRCANCEAAIEEEKRVRFETIWLPSLEFLR